MLSQRSAASWMRSATDSLLKSNSLLCMPPVSSTAVVSASSAREHVRGMEGQPVRARGRPVPGLPHARPPPPVARHPRSRDGALGAHDRRARRRLALPGWRHDLRDPQRREHARRPRLPDVCHASGRAERRARRPGGRGRRGKPRGTDDRARRDARSLTRARGYAALAWSEGGARIPPTRRPRRPPRARERRRVPRRLLHRLLREPACPRGGAWRGADSRGARRDSPLALHDLRARDPSDVIAWSASRRSSAGSRHSIPERGLPAWLVCDQGGQFATNRGAEAQGTPEARLRAIKAFPGSWSLAPPLLPSGAWCPWCSRVRKASPPGARGRHEGETLAPVLSAYVGPPCWTQPAALD